MRNWTAVEWAIGVMVLLMAAFLVAGLAGAAAVRSECNPTGNYRQRWSQGTDYIENEYRCPDGSLRWSF